MASQSYMRYICIALGLLFADAAIEMGFVTGTVAFLHSSGQGPFTVADPSGSTFQLSGHPANLIVDQGHTSNGAGGTCVVLLGFGGVLALWLENRERRINGRSSPIFFLWSLLTILSWLLTLTALIYSFVIAGTTSNQSIDLAVAAANAFPAAYPKDKWAPDNWFAAVLDLPLVNQSDRDTIQHYLPIIRGWRYNLIPMFVLGFVLMDLVILEVLRIRRSRGVYGMAASGEGSREKDYSYPSQTVDTHYAGNNFVQDPERQA